MQMRYAFSDKKVSVNRRGDEPASQPNKPTRRVKLFNSFLLLVSSCYLNSTFLFLGLMSLGPSGSEPGCLRAVAAR